MRVTTIHVNISQSITPLSRIEIGANAEVEDGEDWHEATRLLHTALSHRIKELKTHFYNAVEKDTSWEP